MLALGLYGSITGRGGLYVEGEVVLSGVTCGVGAPVALGSIPFKVGLTTGVVNEEGAVVFGLQSPALVSTGFVKRRIGICKSDNNASERGESVAAVSINGNNKDFCIGYVCKVIYGVVNALVVVGSCAYLERGKELTVSGSADQNVVAVLELGGENPLSCGGIGSVVGVSFAAYSALAFNEGVLAGCGDLFTLSDNFFTIYTNSVAGEAGGVAGSFGSTLNNGVGVLALGLYGSIIAAANVNNFNSGNADLLAVRTVLYGLQKHGRAGNGNNSVADISVRTVNAKESVGAIG